MDRTFLTNKEHYTKQIQTQVKLLFNVCFLYEFCTDIMEKNSYVKGCAIYTRECTYIQSDGGNLHKYKPIISPYKYMQSD